MPFTVSASYNIFDKPERCEEPLSQGDEPARPGRKFLAELSAAKIMLRNLTLKDVVEEA